MNAHLTALLGGAVSCSLMFELLRRRQLKEKYAVLWLVVGVGMVVLAVFPGLLDLSARLLGVQSGPNLLLFVAALVLLLVCVHLSWEVSRLEDKSRALAEEIGLLRLEVESGPRKASRSSTGGREVSGEPGT